MKNISTFFEEKKENKNNNNINNIINNNNANVVNFSVNDSNKNIFSKKFLEKKKFNFNSIINNSQLKDKSKDDISGKDVNEKYLLTKLDSMKSLIKEEISTNYLMLSNEVQNLPQDFLVITGIKDEISKFHVTCNESNEYVFYFTSKENDKNILFIIAININSQCKFAKINLSYGINIKIIDFKITLKNELLLLVKSLVKKDKNDKFDEVKEYKFSLISSDLSNYVFYDIQQENNNNGKLVINFGNYNGNEDINIDVFADVECNDDSFLALTGKGFITLVDNSLNKIEIFPSFSWLSDENESINYFYNKKEYLKQRSFIIKNIKKVCSYFSISLSTYFLTVYYFDQVCSKFSSFNQNSLLQISLFCLILASKFNEETSKAVQMQNALKGNISKNYCEDEKYVLNLLNYKLNVHTPYDILMDILHSGFIFEGEEFNPKKMSYICSNLGNILYIFSGVNSYVDMTPKQVAFSIVGFARELLGLSSYSSIFKKVFMISQNHEHDYVSGLEIIKKKIKIEGKFNDSKEDETNSTKCRENNFQSGKSKTIAIICNKCIN